MALPLCRQCGAVHDLNSVLAVRIGMMQAQTQRFPIGEIEVIDHGEILRCRRRILDGGGNIVGIQPCLQPAGIAACMAVHIQTILILLQNIPGTFRILYECAGSKCTGNNVNIFAGLEAIGAIPVGIDLLTVDRQLGVIITGIAGDGQLNSVANFAGFLVSNDAAVGRICHIDRHIFADIHQLEGQLCNLAIVAVQGEADLGGRLVHTAGLAACYHHRKVVGANFLSVNIDVGRGAGDLHAVFDAAVLDLGSLRIGQSIAGLPCRCHCAAAHGLNAVNTVGIRMVQANTELLTVGELEDVCQRIILGVRRQVLGYCGDIVGGDHRLYGGVYTFDALFMELSVVLTGDVPGFCVSKEGRALHIHCGVTCNAERNLQQFLVCSPGFKAQPCGICVVLLLQDLDLNQFLIQPDSGIIALTHHAQLNAVAAGIALDLLCIQRVDRLPVGKGVVAGDLGILQDVLSFFLQQVNMPGLAVAELDLQTGALLRVIVACAPLCQFCIILQVCPEGEITVRSGAEDLAGTCLLIKNAVILLVQDPAASLGDLEVIVFQDQFCVEVLIQVNAAADRVVAFLLCLQGVEALLHIFQQEIALGIHGQRLFALRSDISQQKALQRVAGHIVQNDLTAQRLFALGHCLCICRDRYTLGIAGSLYGYAAILIEGNFLDHFLAVYDHRGQRIALFRNDGGNRIHTQQHRVVALDGVMFSLLQGNRYVANNALAVEAEVFAHLREGRAILLCVEVPVSVNAGIRSCQIIGSDMGGVDINKSVFHRLHVHIQPLHIIPGDEKLHAIAVTICCVHFATLGGSAKYSHNIVCGRHIGIAVPLTVAPLEKHIAGRHQVDLKHIILLHACHMRQCKIHFDTAIHIGRTVEIYIDGHRLRYIVHEIYALFAKVAGHGDIDLIAAVFIMKIEPIVILVSFFVQYTVDLNAGICFRLCFIGVYIGILFFGRYFIDLSFLYTACKHYGKQCQHKQHSTQGFSFHCFHRDPSLLAKNSDFGNADGFLSFRHFHGDLHRLYIQFVEFCIGRCTGSDVVKAAIIIVCLEIFRAELDVVNIADNFLALFLADKFHCGNVVECHIFQLGVVYHHRTHLPCLLKIKSEGGGFGNSGFLHMLNEVRICVLIDRQQAISQMDCIFATANSSFICNVHIFCESLDPGLHGAGRAIGIHNIQVVAILILNGDPLDLIDRRITGRTGSHNIVVAMVNDVHILTGSNEAMVTGAGNFLAAGGIAGDKDAAFGFCQLAVGSQNVIGDRLTYLIGAVCIAAHRESHIVKAIMLHHKRAFVDAVSGFIGNGFHRLTGLGCLPILHRVELVAHNDGGSAPIGLQPVFHLYTANSVGVDTLFNQVVACVIDPEQILIAVFIHIGMGVNTANVTAPLCRQVAAHSLVDKCIIVGGVEKQIFCIIVRISIHHIAICIFLAGGRIEGMYILCAAAGRIFEIHQLEVTVRTVGNRNHQHIAAVAILYTVAGLNGFCLGSGAEEHIVAAIIGIIDHFRRPNVLPGGTANFRCLAGFCPSHVIQCIANRLPLHQILGAIAIHRVFCAVQVVIAISCCIVQHKGVRAVGLFVIAVEKVFVVVRFLLTFRQLTLVIGYFILGLHLLSASSQKTTQHGDQQKKGQASFGCLFHK